MNKKTGLLLFLLVGIILAGSIIFLMNRPQQAPISQPVIPTALTTPTAQFDPLNATYTIENTPVTLVNGKVMTDSKVSTSIFGQPAIGDLNGDGIDDAVITLVQDQGGSGTFYYVAAAINTSGVARGTNAILLGDRIAPQNTLVQSGQIIANYADRKPTDPMVTPPSVGVSKYIVLDGTILKEIPSPTQGITYLTSKEATTKYCDGVTMDSVGYQKTITTKESTSTKEMNPTNVQIIKETLNAATTGMCNTVMNQLDITEQNGIVTVPPIDAWAGVSITMCSCKPQVETNILQIPGMKSVVWK